MRIISICPSNTELLAYLEMTDYLIAIDDYSDWPSVTKKLPRVGPDLDINIDEVERLNPDLVLASLSVPGMEKNVSELQKRNIPHIVFNPNSLEQISSDLLTLGKVLGISEKAEHVVQKYYDVINKYRQLASTINHRAQLYWEWWPKPVFTPGKLNWLTEISLLAGGVNIFSDIEQASIQTDWESVRKRNPEHICLAWVGVRTEKVNLNILEKRPGWNEMEAWKHKRVYVLEEELYCRPSPRLLMGLKKLASILHPHIFPSDDGLDPILEQ